MAKSKKINNNKYNYGSYILRNQQLGSPTIPEQNVGASTVSGVASGAAMGASFGLPGMVIGGVLGGVGNALKAGSANRKRRNQQKQLRTDFMENYGEEYNEAIGTTDNPFGTYEDGGDVLPNIINIEKGELEIDPTTGKILREFRGINPETGGKYEDHAKKGKDTKHNMVTATEGNFIITKAKAKEYKDALKNNDQLHLNSIKSNIRNKKRQSMKYQDGGLVKKPNLTHAVLQGINPVTTPTQLGSSLPSPSLSSHPFKPDIGNNNMFNINSESFINHAVGLLPSVTNMIQGSSTPDYLPTSTSPRNRFTNRILANQSRELNFTPMLNRVYRDRNNAYNTIDNATNSSSTRRANRLNVLANTQVGIQDMMLSGEEFNNNVRLRNADILSNLGQQELNQFAQDRQFNSNVQMINSQMGEGRRQQFNRGVSQIGDYYQNNRNINSMMDREDMLLDLMSLYNPEGAQKLMDYRLKLGRRGR